MDSSLGGRFVKVIGYDVGTTGFKAGLFDISRSDIKFICGAVEHYPLIVLPNGGTEQNPDDWWRAMCRSTKYLLQKSGTPKEEIKGIACSAQCCTLVMVDENGNALRPAMNIMDTRATDQHKRLFNSGLAVAGMNIPKLLQFLKINNAAPVSSKDTVYRYNWVRENEPEIFKRTYKWLDCKDYLNARATGRMATSMDDAYVQFLLDIKTNDYSKRLCDLVNVDMEHLPEILKSTDIVGELLPGPAEELGLEPGTAVISGGTDVSMCQVGSGAILPGDVDVNSGTSGWVCTAIDTPTIDIFHSIGGLVGVTPGEYYYMADCETAGKCMEWCKERLSNTPFDSYDIMYSVASQTPAGSNGVIFSPWMHGNRCPFEDANTRGVFFNVDVDNRSGDLCRAVLEGVCMHFRWLLETEEQKIKTNEVMRFTGGSAMTPLVAQILSDVTGRPVEVTEEPRQVGTQGAAVTIGIGLGVYKTTQETKDFIRVANTYTPNMKNKDVYDRIFPVFKDLYNDNKKSFAKLNADLKMN